MTRSIAAFSTILVLGYASAASADTIYKCGEAYTNLPCRGGKVLFDNPLNSREEDRVAGLHRYYQNQLYSMQQYYLDREREAYLAMQRQNNTVTSVTVSNDNNVSTSSGASAYGGRSEKRDHRKHLDDLGR